MMILVIPVCGISTRLRLSMEFIEVISVGSETTVTCIAKGWPDLPEFNKVRIKLILIVYPHLNGLVRWYFPRNTQLDIEIELLSIFCNWFTN